MRAHTKWMTVLHVPLPHFSPSSLAHAQYDIVQLLYMKLLWDCLWLSPLVCKVRVGKGRLRHYVFKEQSMAALCSNQGAVIDEDPMLRLNQRLHILHCTGRMKTAYYCNSRSFFICGVRATPSVMRNKKTQLVGLTPSALNQQHSILLHNGAIQ